MKIKRAFFSPKQAIVCGGHCLYRLTTGETAKVTEITDNEKPSSAWDDFQFVGEVDWDEPDVCLKTTPHQSLAQVLKNFAKVDPEEFKRSFADKIEMVERMERSFNRSNECPMFLYKVGKCSCGNCETEQFKEN